MNKNENTCPNCNNTTIEFLETFWESDDEISVECQCSECGKKFIQHYDVTYRSTTED